MEIWNDQNLIKVLKEGGIAVMPTDTLYGIVGRAEDVIAVEKIYGARKRTPEKPCIILIGDIGELRKFSVSLTDKQKEALKDLWSFNMNQVKAEATSIVFECLDDSLTYLHRGTNTLAFRLPASQSLRDLLIEVGPLVAPSANTEGMPPSQDIEEAKKYFGDLVNIYMDGGTIAGKASKVITLNTDGTTSIIRE